MFGSMLTQRGRGTSVSMRATAMAASNLRLVGMAASGINRQD